MKVDSSNIEELAVRYLDDNLTAEEVAALDQAICQSDELLDEFESVVAQACFLSACKDPLTESTVSSQAISFWAKPGVWLAAAVIVALIAVPWMTLTEESEPIATFTFDGGSGRLWNHESPELIRIVPEGETVSLKDGQSFRLVHSDSSAEALFTDGTVIRFFQQATGEIHQPDDQKVVVLQSGQMSADVVPQPAGKPMEIATPSSRMEVIGTELEVSASSTSTNLVVNEGAVAMIRGSDGVRIEVGSGQRATASASDDSTFVATEVPELLAEWGSDFDTDPGSDWTGGKWQPDGTMLAHPRFDLGYSHFAVVSSNAWGEGIHSHFQVHPDSVLRLRFKMETPQWFIIRIGLRATPDSERNYGGNAFYQNNKWHRGLRSGEWRTLEIPLREIHHFSRSGNKDVDLAGLGAYLVSISTQKHDAGLVIDEIGVRRASETND